jgi:two-component system LytT family response regulator
MNPKIRCIIIDDEPLAVELLQEYASNLQQLQVVLATTNPLEAVNYLQNHPADLIFIDIQMPQLTGIQFMQLFNNQYNFIITSAYPNYALESYNYKVIDYLLKPITFAKFHQAITKFNTMVQLKTTQELFIKSEGKQVKINPKDIVYIEGLSDYIRLHVATQRHIVYDNLKDFINKLPTQQFMRIHKSYIVNLEHIQAIDGNRVLHTLGTAPIGETYKATVKQWIENSSS